MKKGDVVGNMTYFLNEKEIGKIDVIADENIKRAGFFDYLQKILKCFRA